MKLPHSANPESWVILAWKQLVCFYSDALQVKLNMVASDGHLDFCITGLDLED